MADTSVTIKRIAIALLGQALPENGALAEILKNLRNSFIAIVIAGILISSLILLSCFSFFKLLIVKGFSQWAAIGITGLIIMLIAVLSGLSAQRYARKAKEVRDNMGLFSKNKQLASYIEIAIKAFLEGAFESSNCNKNQKEDPITPSSN